MYIYIFLNLSFVYGYRVGQSSFFDVVSGDYHCSSMVDTLADKMIPDTAIQKIINKFVACVNRKS
jgi:hypothetical protein